MEQLDHGLCHLHGGVRHGEYSLPHQPRELLLSAKHVRGRPFFLFVEPGNLKAVFFALLVYRLPTHFFAHFLTVLPSWQDCAGCGDADDAHLGRQDHVTLPVHGDSPLGLPLVRGYFPGAARADRLPHLPARQRRVRTQPLFLAGLRKFRAASLLVLVLIYFEVTRTAGLKTSEPCATASRLVFAQRLPRGRRGRLLPGRAKAGRVSRQTKHF